MTWITPYHQDTDFVWPLCLEDKIRIFEERVSGWQLDIADACINGGRPEMRHSGWAVLMIVFSYFEHIGKCRVGAEDSEKSQDRFRIGLEDVFPGLTTMPSRLHDDVASILYTSGRCGFYHSGMAQQRIIISGDYSDSVALSPGGVILINPHRLVPDLKEHSQRYVAELRDPANEETRRNFEKHFDYLHELDPLEFKITKKTPLIRLTCSDSRYPARVRAALGPEAPAVITALGNTGLLDCPLSAVFCSMRCPGGLIMQAQDLAHELRDNSAALVGGFHTPVEQAFLDVMLAGAGPLVVCLARGRPKMLEKKFRKPLEDGRLLLLSPFDDDERRVTAELAATRNRFVAALAERVLFIHAAPGGRTEALAREVIGWGKPAYALAHPANANLMDLGARVLNDWDGFCVGEPAQ